ncbi:MAG: tetratricopeptide repeat protein [Spirochaetes bacterium]|nr:tetratricopeptide repeat protein [Spirochaetota bacterium]
MKGKFFKIMLITMCVAWMYGDTLARERSSDIFQQGMEAFKAGNFKSAALIFKKIVDAGDEYRDQAWYYLGLSIFKQKKYDSAIFEFNRFLLECTTSNFCALSRYWIAESEYHRKNYIKAIEEYNRFIAQSPDEKMIAQAKRRIGDIYFLQSRYDEAIIEWQKAVEMIDDESRKRKLVLKIGEAFFLNEKYDEAANVLDSLRANKSDTKIYAKASLLLGRIHQLKGDHKKSIRYFTQVPDALLRESPFFDVQYFKAKSYLELGQKSAAKTNLEMFLIMGKDSEWINEAKYELGRILLDEKKESKGIKLLEEARTSTTKMELRSSAARELAKIYLKKGAKEAIPYLEDSVSVNDPDEQKKAIFLLSKAYVEVDRNEDAERLLNLLIEKNPFDENLEAYHFLLARAHLGKNEIEAAEKQIAKIKQINPRSNYLNEMPYYLALALHRAGNANNALENLKKYIQFKNPEKPFEARVKLHEIYFEIGDFANSKVVFDGLMRQYKMHPEMETLAFKTGMAYREKGIDYPKPFDFVLEINPRSDYAGQVCLLRGDDAFKQKDYATAERWYKKYLMVPQREYAHAVFLYWLISLYRLDRHLEVLRAYRDINEYSLDEFTERRARFWTAKSLYKLEKFSSSYAYLKELDLELFSDEDLIMMVDVALHEKDIQRAKKSAELLKRNPESCADANFRIGKFFAMHGNYIEARKYFEKVAEEYPFSERLPYARIELADLNYKEKKYIAALKELADVNKPELFDKKISLTIACYYNTNNPTEAEILLEKHLEALTNSPYGEIAFRESMKYYYEVEHERNFKKYANLFRKYPGNANEVDYYTAKYEFKQGDFNNAFYSFYKLSVSENQFRREALYHLGLISFLGQDSPTRGEMYFKKLVTDEQINDIFVQKAILFMALNLQSKGASSDAKQYLEKLLFNSSHVSMWYRAMNLYEYLGFDKGEKSKKIFNLK